LRSTMKVVCIALLLSQAECRTIIALGFFFLTGVYGIGIELNWWL